MIRVSDVSLINPARVGFSQSQSNPIQYNTTVCLGFITIEYCYFQIKIEYNIQVTTTVSLLSIILVCNQEFQRRDPTVFREGECKINCPTQCTGSNCSHVVPMVRRVSLPVTYKTGYCVRWYTDSFPIIESDWSYIPYSHRCFYFSNSSVPLRYSTSRNPWSDFSNPR